MEHTTGSGYAEVNGLEMYYEIHGNGEVPLVLIHGGGSTIQTSFGEILPLLAGKRQVIGVELQAHGRTSDREGPSSFEQDADDVAALMQHLDIGHADFFGFSNGGNTAMQIAVRHPKLVRKLVLASAFFRREGMIPGFFDTMKTATLDSMPGQLKEAFLDLTPDFSKLETMHSKDRDRMVAFVDWPDRVLESIAVPTLVVAADKDVMSVEHTLEMSRLIPHSELMILPGIHGSFLGEICTARKGSLIPSLVVAAVEEFLEK